MTCANCGAENELGRKFCLSCGQSLAVSCPHCGSPNTPGARFCGECGKPLADDGEAPAIRDAGAVPATERRLVSVLFADLVGFTTLSEGRDAEDVRELLAAYFETCRAIVERYGGTVEKFIGDAVMAVWGTPTAQEDDAERAVRAALELVEAVRRLGAERQTPELALRAAVHTGEAVVTIGAAGMGMVAGDLVNTASRLQSVAAPGTVLVGEGTQRATGGSIVFEAAGEHELRGKAAPVAAFRALRVVAQRGGVGRAGGLEPPFVGRDAELQLIKDFYHATAHERGPRLVSVIGQPGIGKSRLAWEFLKYIDGVTEVVYWHQGRSPAYGEGISFWALGEMVRMRLGIGEEADEATTRERLDATLEEFVTDADERRTLTDPLLHLLGIGDSKGRERSQLFGAWRTFFERIAETGPVVMVFEDLQWADDGLLDFIEEVLTWSRGRSLYLITLARPELLDRRPTWGAGRRSFTSLGLAPLGRDEMTSLLAGLVPGLPASVTDQIVSRAEGIPLYAVETVRTLLNDGRIERDGDTFRPVGDLSRLTIPESLQALIAARIDALSAESRTLVQDASVLGLSFGLASLKAVARSSADEIEPILGHLVQRELFTVDDDPRSPERGQYRFVQGLLREVAYGTLSRDDRRARHLAAARHYEALGDDELSGVLAQHYLDAYQAHPDGPEGAAVAAQARVALRGAAQRATQLGSFRLAHASLESALRVTTDPAEELDLRMFASDASANAGIFDRAIEHADRAIELADAIGDAYARRLAIAKLATILTEGQQERAIAMLTEALAEPGLAPDDPGYVELATVTAQLEMRRTNFDRSIELAARTLPVAARAGAEEAVLQLLITQGVALSSVSRTMEAVVILTGAIDVARRRSMANALNRATVNLGFVLANDDPRAAFEVSRSALDESLRTGSVWGFRYLLGNAVDGAIEIGEWDWALATMADREDMFSEIAERLWFGAYRSIIGTCRGEDVLETVRDLRRQGEAFDDVQYRAIASVPLVMALSLRGDAEQAIALMEEVQRLGAVGIDTTIHAARAAIWSGNLEAVRRMRLAHDDGPAGRRQTALSLEMDAGIAMLERRHADARRDYQEALRLGREIDVPPLVAMCDLDIIITGAMEPDERRRAADEAREIFTRLGATALLDRLDAALAQPPATVTQRVRSEVRERIEH